MAKNKVEIDVNIDDKGTTKKVGLGAKKAADNIDRVGKSAHSTDRQLKGAAQASSNTTKNFSKMSQGISGGLVPAYATLAAQLFAVSAAFNFLKRAGDLKTLQAGQKAFAASTGVALKSLANDIIEATDSQIAFEEASRAAAIGTAAGLSPEQLTRLGAAAKSVSIILGRDVTDSFNRLVRGVTKAEPELLDELGIILRLKDATKEYKESLKITGRELTSFERTQAVTNFVLGQAEEKYLAIEAATGLQANQFNKLGKAFDDVIIKLKSFVATIAGPMAKVLTDFPILVGAAFAFFLKGILVAALPNLAAFGNAMREVADQGILKFAGLEAQLHSTNRALLAAGAASPATRQKMGAASRGEVAGILTAAGLTTGVFTGAAAGRDVGAGQYAKIIKNIKDEIKKGNIPQTVMDEIEVPMQDAIATTEKGGKKTAKATNKAGLGLLGLQKISLESFGKIGTGLAKVGQLLIRAFSFVGIASLVVSFGLLAKNIFFAKKASEEFNDEQSKTRLEQDIIVGKLEELNKEYEHFVTVQGILNSELNQQVKALGAIGNMMASLSSARFTKLLGGDEVNKLNANLKKTAEAAQTVANARAKLLRLEGKEGRVPTEARKDARSTISALQGVTFEGTMQDSPLGIALLRERDAIRQLGPELLAAKPALTKFLAEVNGLENGTRTLDATFIQNRENALKLAQSYLAVAQAFKAGKDAVNALQSAFIKVDPKLTNLRTIRASIATLTKPDGITPDDALSDPQRQDLKKLQAQETLFGGLVSAQQAEDLRVAALKGRELQSRVTAGPEAGFQREERERNLKIKNLQDELDFRTKIQTLMQTALEQDRARNEEERIFTADQTADMEEQIKLLQIQGFERSQNIAKIQQEADFLFQLGETLKQTLETGLGTALQNIIMGAKSASEAFKDMGRAIVSAMANLAATKSAEMILGSLFPTMFGRTGIKNVAEEYRYGGMSRGGIARGPQAGYPAILHGNEAVVPLPNGDKIPVELKGGMGGDINNISISITTDGSMNMGGGDANEESRNLGKVIAGAVQKELINQKRPGGILSPLGAA